MSQTNYFYIITRDGQIFEVEYTEQRISMAVQTMRDKGLFTIKDGGMVINGADISKVLNDENYENYISTVRPREYIRNGSWYDGKENKILRHEKWKQDRIDSMKHVALPYIEQPQEETMTYGEFIKKFPNKTRLSI